MDSNFQYAEAVKLVVAPTGKSGLELRRKRGREGAGLSQVSNVNRLCHASLQAPQFFGVKRLETRSLQCSDDDGPKADLAREHNMHGNRRVALAGELELLNPPRCRAG
jgi:hypothetical protein